MPISVSSAIGDGEYYFHFCNCKILYYSWLDYNDVYADDEITSKLNSHNRIELATAFAVLILWFYKWINISFFPATAAVKIWTNPFSICKCFKIMKHKCFWMKMKMWIIEESSAATNEGMKVKITYWPYEWLRK